MESGSSKITVLMITFNQESYIRESLDSIFQQSIHPYEIIISDDCSTDKTWQIIQEYVKKYSAVIKAYKNEKNLGIYGNYENAKKYITGNIICSLAGDDLFTKDAFKTITDAVIKHELNPDENNFILVTNFYIMYPNGVLRSWNNYLLKNISPLKSRLRNDLSYRGIGLSAKLLTTISTTDIREKYPNIHYGVDTLKGIQEIIAAEKIIFVNAFTNYYRADVGVTSQAGTHNPFAHFNLCNILLEKEYKILWDQKDLDFIYYMKALSLNKMHPSLNTFAIVLFHYIKNINNFTPNVNWKIHFKNVLMNEKIRKIVKPIILWVFQKRT